MGGLGCGGGERGWEKGGSRPIVAVGVRGEGRSRAVRSLTIDRRGLGGGHGGQRKGDCGGPTLAVGTRGERGAIVRAESRRNTGERLKP